ncbi:MAG: hypothetical protein E7033_08410 [Akkermansiaceae bacterium]|nr:hypothetical protein [Akkermansiaceae bacterium]
MKRIIPIISLLASAAFASPLPQQAELLAVNKVEAHYLGTVHIPCRHKTADCPDKCNHGYTAARFRVVRNLNYEKIGQYGDDCIEPGAWLYINLSSPTPGQDDEALFRFIDKLKVGDSVRITQKHYYGQQGDCMEPFRPVTDMERDEKSAKVPATPPALPGQYPVMPIAK